MWKWLRQQESGLKGRVVVITGASAGVGRATAREFACHGADVAVLARDPARLDQACQEINAEGVRSLAVPIDVSDPAAVEEAADQVERELGPIDIWVNDAMATIFARVWEVHPDEIKRATEVTYLGAVYGTMAALKRMRTRDRGTIVEVGSALAYRAIPLQAAYCASKFALRGFTDSTRCELMSDGSGVHITMVHLPGLNTPQFDWVRVRGLGKVPRPVAPVYSPEVAARGIVLAATRQRREVWVGGSTVATILGSRLFAPLVDRYLARTNIAAQQSDTPIETNRKDNLFHPVPSDVAAHGSYRDEEKQNSIQLALSRHRVSIGLLAAMTVATAATGAVMKAVR